jgi:hypothetical protein
MLIGSTRHILDQDAGIIVIEGTFSHHDPNIAFTIGHIDDTGIA